MSYMEHKHAVVHTHRHTPKLCMCGYVGRCVRVCVCVGGVCVVMNILWQAEQNSLLPTDGLLRIRLCLLSKIYPEQHRKSVQMMSKADDLFRITWYYVFVWQQFDRTLRPRREVSLPRYNDAYRLWYIPWSSCALPLSTRRYFNKRTLNIVILSLTPPKQNTHNPRYFLKVSSIGQSRFHFPPIMCLYGTSRLLLL